MNSEVRQEIDRVNSKFVKDFNGGDIEAAASVYTEDAKIMPPGSTMVEGRGAIREFWSGATKQMGITGVSLKTIDLEVDGNMAYELGTYTLSGESGPLDNGKYVVVWKRTGGEWKWHRDIWNSNKA